MKRRVLSLPLLLLPLAACITERGTAPPRTATEQLLISSAVDLAAEKMRLALPPGTPIFIDVHDFASADAKDADAKYAAAVIEDRFARQGLAIVPDPKQANVIVQLRAGALSIDQKTILVGIPAMAIPIPLTATAIPTPQVALFSQDVETGVAKLGATGYGAHDGRFRAGTGTVVAVDKKKKKVVLLFFGSTKNEFEPAQLRDMDKSAR